MCHMLFKSATRQCVFRHIMAVNDNTVRFLLLVIVTSLMLKALLCETVCVVSVNVLKPRANRQSYCEVFE